MEKILRLSVRGRRRLSAWQLGAYIEQVYNRLEFKELVITQIFSVLRRRRSGD